MDPTPQENQTVVPEASVSGSSKKIAPIIIGVIALLVVGGGAFALMQSGVLKGGKPASFAGAYEAFTKTNTMHLEESLVLELGLKPGILGGAGPTDSSAPKLATPPLTHVTFSLKGDVDQQDITKPRLDAMVKIIVDSPGFALTYDAEMRLLSDKDAYFKLNSFPMAGFLPSMPLNQWIHAPITPTDPQALSQLPYGAGLGAVDAKKFEEIKKVFDSATLLQLTTRKKGPVTAGEQTEDLSFTIPKENLVAFLKNAASAFGQPMSDDDATDLARTLDKAEITGDMIIGRSTQRPYAVNYRIVPNIASLEQYVDRLVLTGTVTFSDYDKPITIETPTGAIESDQLFPNTSIKAFGEANNSARQSNVTTILNAIQQYAIDNHGQLPATIPMTEKAICKTGASSCVGLVDLSVLTKNQIYIVNIPIDPMCEGSACKSGSTGYTVWKDSSGKIHVKAPMAELGEVIEITR